MSQSKFNWGTGILITIILFMLIVISTAVYLMNQDVDLVTNDYYNKGINHQQQIDRMNRTNAMDDEVQISPENGYLKLKFPKSYAQKSFNGTIQFYRPSDSKEILLFRFQSIQVLSK
jgi:FixH.